LEPSPKIESLDPPAFVEGGQFVVRVQPFGAGGYEGSAYFRDRDAYRHNPLGITKPRDEKRDPEKIREKNAMRAKRRVRWLCREIGADTLVTFTTREIENDRADLMRRFARFVRRYREALGGVTWLYVAVAEPHPSNPGHWHIHVATRGGVRITTARDIWWDLCGGRGMGNIHAKRFNAPEGETGSVALARYVSKYVTKGFEEDEDRPEKERRFRAAIIPLADRHKLVLEADAPELALKVLLRVLRLGRGDMAVFFYRDGSGFFFSCNGEMSDGPPPF